MMFAMSLIILVPVVLSYKFCSRNENVKKSIQHQLKLLEDDDCRCPCEQKRYMDVTQDGFFATSSKNLESLASNAIVVFDTVTTNVGGGYDPSTGIFTATMNGLYFFSWTTVTRIHKYCYTCIDLNGKLLACNHGDGRISSTANFPSSQSVVVQMKKDDKVTIRTSGTPDQFMYGDKWSTFIGYRI